ncbi:MAG: hypothetical protein ACE5DL_01630 [Nitrosopumilaceae archaeon]
MFFRVLQENAATFGGTNRIENITTVKIIVILYSFHFAPHFLHL